MAEQNKEIDFSRLVKQEAKKYNISVREKCFADLMAAGWKDIDAYLMAGLYNIIYPKETNLRDMNRLILEDNEFKAYMALARRRANRVKPDSAEKDELPEIDMQAELSKENQLRELLIAKAKQPVGSKEWLDIKKMIADITHAKKDEIQAEDNTIHYYLPLTCNQCELYKKHKKKQENWV